MKRVIKHFSQLLLLYHRCSAKLFRLFSEGKNMRKQRILSRRLQKMHYSLVGLKKSFLRTSATAFFIGSMASFHSQMADAQTFIQQTGTANPFNGVDVGYFSAPSFVNIDNDGDMDAFIGEQFGTIRYYKNTGIATLPALTLQSGNSNPFNGVDIGSNSMPAFVNIDGDGDLDVFIGNQNGTISYFKNTGTASAPVFAGQTGSSNPFNDIDVGQYSAPCFVDIDGDGDVDAFIGALSGIIHYYKNTGTPFSPLFALQSGTLNPLNSVDVGDFSTPAFVDIDIDGDMDLFIGELSGTILYYKNTGTAAAPVFTLQTGSSNPFDGINTGGYSTPAFVDIDGDGDKDAFSGEIYGSILYYKNTESQCINPATGGAVASSQSIFNGTAPAAFTSSAPAGGQSGTLEYKWQSSTSDPSVGFTDIGSTNSETFAPDSLTVTTWFKRLARVTCQTNWIGAAESNVLQITVITVPPALELQNISVNDNQCFNATQTITLAGSGSSFNVYNGGHATLIAGQNILFYPGAIVEPGGYLSGTVSPEGPWCPFPSMVTVNTGNEIDLTQPDQTGIKIYPNPTSGVFSLELSLMHRLEKAHVEIYEIHGRKVLSTELPEGQKHQLSLQKCPAGIYLIHISSAKLNVTSRIIKFD